MRLVEATIIVQAPPSLILDAFTQAEHLKAWWDVEQSLVDLRRGGLYSLTWNRGGASYVKTGIIAEYLPSCQLRIENMVYFNSDKPILGPMELLILTTPEYRATELTVVQSGYQEGPAWDWYYQAVKESWPEMLKRIKGHLESHYQSQPKKKLVS